MYHDLQCNLPFKTLQFAVSQKWDLWAQNHEILKNLNLYKENQNKNVSEGHQNLTKVAKTLYFF